MSGRGQSWKTNLPVIQEESDEEEEELIGAVGGGADAGSVQPVDGAEAAICPICHKTGTENNPLIQACGCQPGYHEMCVNVAIVTPIYMAPNPCAYCGQPFNHPNLRVSVPFRLDDHFTTVVFVLYLITIVTQYLIPSYPWQENRDLAFLQAIYYYLFQALNVYMSTLFGYLYFDPDWPPMRNPDDQNITFRGYDPRTQLPDPGRRHQFNLLAERRAYWNRRQQLADRLRSEEQVMTNIQNAIRAQFGIENMDEVTQEDFDMSNLSAEQCNRLRELLEQFKQSLNRQKQLQQQIRE